MARGRTQGWVEQGGHTTITDGRVSTDKVQQSFPLATVTIFNAGTAVLSNIFSDEGGTPKSNPFSADTTGFWFFWADQGRYDIQFSGAGISAPYALFSVDVVPSASMLADPGSNGIVVRTALGVTTARSLTQPAAGITISNNNGVSGNPTFALANDLNAVEGLGTTGLTARTALDTWTTRSIIGTTNRITITNGDGVAGNPTVDIGANVVTNNGAGTDNAITRFDGITGKIIQDSAVTIADATGNFSVPNNWQAQSVGGSIFQIGSTLFVVTAPTSGSAGTVYAINVGSQTQSSGVVQTLRPSTTYNQTGTAGSDDLAIVRVETAQGSGQHNFIRCLGGAAGSTVQWRVDRLGNIYQTGNPAIIGDVDGNEQLRFIPTASAVNEWTFTNAATGGTPTLTITGSDSDPNGRIAAKGTGRIIIPGYAFVLDVTSNVVGNVGAGLDPLNSFTILADVIANNNDFIEFAYGGTFATNDNDKRINLTIDGQVIFDNPLFDLDGTSPANQWSVFGDIVRISATSVICTANLMQGQISVTGTGTTLGGMGIFAGRSVTLTVANLDTNPVILLLSAEGVANNDITKTKSIVKVTQRL